MEKAFVERDPELQAAIQEQNELADEYEGNPDAALIPLLEESERNVTNTRQRLRYKRRNEVRQEFSRKQAVIDIERQLSGSMVPDEDTSEVSLAEDDMPPEQIRLVDALQAVPTIWTLEGEWQRRNAAVEAIIAYCDYAEGGPLRGRPKRSVLRDGEDDKNKKADDEVKQEEHRGLSAWAKKCQEVRAHIQTAPKPNICFQCGKGYSQHRGLLRHFRPAHLNDRKCNFCDDGMEFLHQMHWQNHAAAVHRLHT
jgi:hypothetical protein